MGLRVNYVKNNKTYQNAYVNCRLLNTYKLGGNWFMNLTAAVWTEDKDLPIEDNLPISKVPHTPGNCIHQETYSHLKSLPKFAGAIDEL